MGIINPTFNEFILQEIKYLDSFNPIVASMLVAYLSFSHFLFRKLTVYAGARISTMSLLKCPNEILLIIAEDLPPCQGDINALAQTCLRLFYLLNPFLYRYNTRQHHSSALSWGVTQGSGNTVRNSLEAGAPYNKSGRITGTIGRRRCVLGCALSELAGKSYFCPEFYEQPISSAARNGQLDIVRAFLEFGVDPDYPNPAGHTPLCLAAQGDHLELVRFLLVNGASPALKNICKIFPLWHATWRRVSRQRLKIKCKEHLQLLHERDRIKWLKPLRERGVNSEQDVGASPVTLEVIPKVLD